jgi:hypothetical protein
MNLGLKIYSYEKAKHSQLFTTFARHSKLDPERDMSQIAYCLAIEGNSQLIRTILEASAGTLDEFFDQPEWKQDSALPMRVPQLSPDVSVRNLGLLEVAGGITMFILSCFGKKIFDEIYDRTLKRPLAPLLDKLFSSSIYLNGKTIELRDVIYLEDIDTVVIVRAIVNEKTVNEVVPLFLMAHRVAHAYIEAHGRQAPVHCHIIENGKVSIEPELFLSVKHESWQSKQLSCSPN